MRGERGVELRGAVARDERCGGGADRGAVFGSGHAAGAAAERVGARGGIGEQAGEQRSVGAGHVGGALAEQRAGARADALRLAAQRDEVEIGLEHLVVRPVCGERLCGAHLAELGAPVALAGLGEARIEERSELHREGRGAARAVAGPARADGAGDREPVDPAVRPEAAVFASHHGGADDGADGVQRYPCEAAALEIDALAVEELAVAVVEPRFAGLPVGADGGVGGHGRRPGGEVGGGGEDEQGEGEPGEDVADAVSGVHG